MMFGGGGRVLILLLNLLLNNLNMMKALKPESTIESIKFIISVNEICNDDRQTTRDL